MTEKRVRDSDGQVKTLRTLDAGSRTLATIWNVAKARRDNKRTIGATDVVIIKR